MKIKNFGKNVTFTPRYFYTPKNEDEVLELLNKHVHSKIRVIASGHAWSNAIVSKDVLIDMRYINQVEIIKSDTGSVSVTAGAGCVLQRLLDIIHKSTNTTLPTLGAVKKQTIAGAISTGTHGSGKPSLSHYMDEIRIAAYDPETLQAKIYHYKGGDELRAARCSIGCMGVILSVKFKCVLKYYVAENFVKYKTLKEVIDREEEFPLQQFGFIPYLWNYYVFQRKIAKSRPSGQSALRTISYRLSKFLGTDIFFHLIVVAMTRWSSSSSIKKFYKNTFPSLAREKQNIIDDSEHAITMAHHLFRHVEIEIFSPAINMQRSMDIIKYVVSSFASESIPENIVNDIEPRLRDVGMLEIIKKHKGYYTHHYPIFCRRILPDDTLISMTSNANEPYYSISFFTYFKSHKRQRFYKFVEILARVLTKTCDARQHWGKYFPLAYDEIKHLYPNMNKFHQICQKVDPNGVFRNDYTSQVLGLKN